MEEDVALGNIALDLLGQARGLLSHLGDEDELAYFRDAADFRNPTICELPNGDFGHTMLRALFLDAGWSWCGVPSPHSDDEVVRGVAEKAIKENSYHLRHSSSWVVRLGDGTEESHRRMLDCAGRAVAIHGGDRGRRMVRRGITVVLTEATLPVPDASCCRQARSGRAGHHTAHLEALLAESQSLARAHPGASW